MPRASHLCRAAPSRSLRITLAPRKLKTYPGYPHGMLTTHADVLNAGLLAFVKE